MNPYTDLDDFPDTVDLIDDSDAPTAANINTGPEGLANRTRWLKNRIGVQRTQVFTTNGTFTVPANVHVVTLTGFGGGGGGGGGWDSGTSTATNGTTGAGGGGGAIASTFDFDVTPTDVLPVIIGAGGAGTSANSVTPGGQGTDTTFGTAVFVGASGGCSGVAELGGPLFSNGGASVSVSAYPRVGDRYLDTQAQVFPQFGGQGSNVWAVGSSSAGCHGGAAPSGITGTTSGGAGGTSDSTSGGYAGGGPGGGGGAGPRGVGAAGGSGGGGGGSIGGAGVTGASAGANSGAGGGGAGSGGSGILAGGAGADGGAGGSGWLRVSWVEYGTET